MFFASKKTQQDALRKQLGKELYDELYRAHQRVEAASRGGSSDWDGGGNPHRMMEEDDRASAWQFFSDLCKAHGLDPYECRAIFNS